MTIAAEAFFLLAFLAPPLTVLTMLVLIAVTPSRRKAATPAPPEIAGV
jgi:hypothetical protein